jgi:hypothetical protein
MTNKPSGKPEIDNEPPFIFPKSARYYPTASEEFLPVAANAAAKPICAFNALGCTP